MACPICGRIYCDHDSDERGQSFEEMMADCNGMSVAQYQQAQNHLSSAKKPKNHSTKKISKAPKKK